MYKTPSETAIYAENTKWDSNVYVQNTKWDSVICTKYQGEQQRKYKTLCSKYHVGQ